MAVVFWKLKNGDELIGTVVGGDDYDTVQLEKPMRLILTEKGYRLIHSPVKAIVMDREHLVYTGDVDDDLLVVYYGETGSVIQAKKGLVV